MNRIFLFSFFSFTFVAFPVTYADLGNWFNQSVNDPNVRRDIGDLAKKEGDSLFGRNKISKIGEDLFNDTIDQADGKADEQPLTSASQAVSDSSQSSTLDSMTRLRRSMADDKEKEHRLKAALARIQADEKVLNSQIQDLAAQQGTSVQQDNDGQIDEGSQTEVDTQGYGVDSFSQAATQVPQVSQTTGVINNTPTSSSVLSQVPAISSQIPLNQAYIPSAPAIVENNPQVISTQSVSQEPSISSYAGQQIPGEPATYIPQSAPYINSNMPVVPQQNYAPQSVPAATQPVMQQPMYVYAEKTADGQIVYNYVPSYSPQAFNNQVIPQQPGSAVQTVSVPTQPINGYEPAPVQSYLPASSQVNVTNGGIPSNVQGQTTLPQQQPSQVAPATPAVVPNNSVLAQLQSEITALQAQEAKDSTRLKKLHGIDQAFQKRIVSDENRIISDEKLEGIVRAPNKVAHRVVHPPKVVIPPKTRSGTARVSRPHASSKTTHVKPKKPSKHSSKKSKTTHVKSKKPSKHSSKKSKPKHK